MKYSFQRHNIYGDPTVVDRNYKMKHCIDNKYTYNKYTYNKCSYSWYIYKKINK
jgi:hypothetical protein